MAPQVNLPEGYYQATMRFAGTAVPRGAAIVFGGKVPTSPPGTPTTVGGFIKSAWCNSAGPFQAGGIFSASMTVTDVLVKFGPQDIGASAVTAINQVAGSGGGDCEPPSVALLVQKYTALGGHIGRGRFFIPGVPELQVNTGGSIVTAAVSALQTTFNAMLSALGSNSCNMHLLHRFDDDPAPGDPVILPRVPTEVTSLVVAGTIATQRNRLRR